MGEKILQIYSIMADYGQPIPYEALEAGQRAAKSLSGTWTFRNVYLAKLFYTKY